MKKKTPTIKAFSNLSLKLVDNNYDSNVYMEASYDDDKREVTVTDYNKNPIVYKYDTNMRLDIKDVGNENTVDFDYTNDGYIEKVVDKNGTTSYDYDALHRLIKKTNPEAVNSTEKTTLTDVKSNSSYHLGLDGGMKGGGIH